ncbi:TetR/AcrR family transcriptional regulator [Nesterenkonia ebinurensis]|uniref:TetR/AcrR family transcriptional regulator n=1 Tax=Nesterenkonia ebinurensis TaxID=2608252 RepID=UPI00123C9269|nr:TetR/AcrR family transcriptional regulator [Nesterenkonia ebinurensis]
MATSVTPGGRPRQSGIVTDDPREGIITAAAELFAEKGFNATRMTQIAEASGLRQSSIYYWFRSKDEILRAIMDQNRVSLTAARALAERQEPAPVRLYIVLYQDVVQMCSAPLNFYDLEEAASQQPDVFSDFHNDYGELFEKLRMIIEDGLREGSFRAGDAGDFVQVALNLNEGSQYRFHSRMSTMDDMHRYAETAAEISLRAFLADPFQMEQVQESARAGIAGFRSVLSAEMQPSAAKADA